MNDYFTVPLSELRERRSAKWSRVDAESLPLWVAEMDVVIAEPIRKRLMEAIYASDTGYAGDQSRLIHAFTRFAARRWNWNLDDAECVGFPDLGASGTHLLRHFAGDDGRVVIMPPVYNAFWAWSEDAGIRPHEVPLRCDAPDLDGVARALDDGVRVVLISQPHNPLGRLWTREELQRLATIAAERDAVVISDEIHAPLTYPGHEFVPFLTVSDDARRVGVALHSASKAFNLAGLKASLVVRDASGPTFPQGEDLPWSLGLLGVLAAEAAFDDGDAWLDSVRAGLAARAAHVVSRLGEELPAARVTMPEASFLQWIDLRDAMPGVDKPGEIIHERTGLFVSDGTGFGTQGAGHVRLNIGTSWEILDEALTRLVRACE